MLDYEKIIRSLVEPLVENPEAILIRVEGEDDSKDITILVVSEKDDTSRLIGRKGSVANALREVISVAGKSDKKHIHLKFESFDHDEKVEG